jgi:hypothetical protein
METVRKAWTDERLDDLSRKVDALSGRMDDGFRELRGEISAMQRTMIQFAAVLLAAQIGMIASQLALILS